MLRHAKKNKIARHCAYFTVHSYFRGLVLSYYYRYAPASNLAFTYSFEIAYTSTDFMLLSSCRASTICIPLELPWAMAGE